MSSAAITRTGKRIYDPRASDLYARNPAPQSKMLPKRCDFKDSSGNCYFLVSKNKKLQSWADSSPLMDIIAGEIQQSDSLFFVKQNPESKKEGVEFNIFPIKER